MRTRRDFTFASAGACAGLLLGLTWASGAPDTPTPPPAARIVPQPALHKPVAPLDRHQAPTPETPCDCSKEVEGALTRGELRRRLLDSGQLPMDWPKDLDPSHREPFVAAELVRLLQEQTVFGGLDLDCTEFPCMARIDIPELELEDDTSEAMDEVRALVKAVQTLWPDLQLPTSMSCTADGCDTWLHFGPSQHMNKGVKKRMDVRRHEFVFGVED